MAPLISIVIATHMRPDYLIRTIESVVTQGEEVELIVVADEGSPETRDAIAGALRETDTFLSYPGIRGPSESRNLGRELARGKWICYLDDDDTITPDYIAQVKPHLSTEKVIYSNYTVVQDNTDLNVGALKHRSVAKSLWT